jgi:hypothetical protein
MSKLAQKKFPDERAIDWDEQKQVLDIPAPNAFVLSSMVGKVD